MTLQHPARHRDWGTFRWQHLRLCLYSNERNVRCAATTPRAEHTGSGYLVALLLLGFAVFGLVAQRFAVRWRGNILDKSIPLAAPAVVVVPLVYEKPPGGPR
jgi:hypothetical protein